MRKSPRQIASQQNGKRSKGPKTIEGRLRSAQNAYRHGLSISVWQSPDMPKNIHRLSAAIAGGEADPTLLNLSRQVAEAQLDILRIRQARTRILTEERFQKVDLKRSQGPHLPRRVYHSVNYGKPNTITNKKALTPEEKMQALENILNSIAEARLSPPSVKEMFITLKKLNSLERYERRALSRRNKALRVLDDYRRFKALGV